jgi:hypothetical protein
LPARRGAHSNSKVDLSFNLRGVSPASWLVHGECLELGLREVHQFMHEAVMPEPTTRRERGGKVDSLAFESTTFDWLIKAGGLTDLLERLLMVSKEDCRRLMNPVGPHKTRSILHCGS